MNAHASRRQSARSAHLAGIHGWRLLLSLALIAAGSGAGAAASTLTPDLAIYSSGLTAAAADSSFKGGRLPDSSTVVAGGSALAFSGLPSSGLQLYFIDSARAARAINATKYSGLSFKLAAAADFVPDARLVVGVQVSTATNPSGELRVVPLGRYLAGGAARATWQAVHVPLADLGAGAALSKTLSVLWHNQAGGSQTPTLFLESLALVALPASCAGGTQPQSSRPPPPRPRPTPPRPRTPQPKPRPPPPRPRPPPPRPRPRPPSPSGDPRSLYTAGNGIFWPHGRRFTGRGFNVHDTRSCGACLGRQNATEVKRRIDFAVNTLGASFFRLMMEAYVAGDNNAQYCYPNCAISEAYLQDVAAILDHVDRNHKGVQVIISAWTSQAAWGFTSLGWPTAATNAPWQQLVRTVGRYPFVWFGVVNEPQSNFNGALDSQVWAALNSSVAAIRQQEAALGQAPHIVTVQGTRGWARELAYYVDHPITAGGGKNVVYETHPYNPQADFDRLFVVPARTLPVVIAEFGPLQGMGTADCVALMQQAGQLSLPWLAWTLHERCSSPENTGNVLQDFTPQKNGCGIGVQLSLTSWGELVASYL